MADSELLRHQKIYHGFNQFVKIGTGFVIALVIVLGLTLVR